MENLYKEILSYSSSQYHHNTKLIGMERVIRDFFIWNHDKTFQSKYDVIYFGIYNGKPLYLNSERIEDMSKNGGSYPNFNYVFSVKCENDSVIINQLTEHLNLGKCLTACVLKLYQYYK